MTNFITNEKGKDLKKRLVELIENSKELKFLVGFFYFSGIAELYESIKDRPDFKIKDDLATIRNSVFITGSSNLTRAGLSNQHEFNVELGDFGTEDADKYFDELWANSILITEKEQYKQELINLLKKETLIAEPTPFEAYVAILQHYLDAQS